MQNVEDESQLRIHTGSLGAMSPGRHDEGNSRSHVRSLVLNLSVHESQRVDHLPPETGTAGGLGKESLPGAQRAEHHRLTEDEIT